MPYSALFFESLARFAADPAFWLIGLATIGLIAFSKGAFGGGAASIGVPILSLLIDPVGAAIIVAPLVSFMDAFALRAFGAASWSKPDLKVLIPGLLMGLALGWWLFEKVDPHIVAAMIGGISLSFALYWFWRRIVPARIAADAPPPQPALGFLAGAASGFTTFIAHAGGPPVAMYLIRRRLDKTQFVGTNTAFFTLGNLLKLGPYGLLLTARPDAAAAALLLSPIVPAAVLFGVKVHHGLTQDRILILCNGMLILGGLRLLSISLKPALGL